MAKTRRPGSGRTKGSFSFVTVTLGQLNAKFADQTQPITVGRKWAEIQGFQNLTSAPANSIMNSIAGTTPETKVDTKTVDLLGED